MIMQPCFRIHEETLSFKSLINIKLTKTIKNRIQILVFTDRYLILGIIIIMNEIIFDI